MSNPVLCNVCQEPVIVYEAKYAEKATCPEHCPEHEYHYDKWERGHYCANCGDQAPPDYLDID